MQGSNLRPPACKAQGPLLYGFNPLLAPLYKCRQIKELVLSCLYKSRLLFAVLRTLSLDTV